MGSRLILLMDNLSTVKNKVRLTILVAVTILVAWALHSELSSSKSIAKSSAQIDIDRSELVLRINDTLISVGNLLLGPNYMDRTEQETKQLARQAMPLLAAAQSNSPKDPVVLTKCSIVANYLGEPADGYTTTLKGLTSPKAQDLLQILESVYGERTISKADVPPMRQNVERLLPPSWYRDRLILMLAKKGGDQHLFEEQEEQLSKRSLGLFLKLLLLAGAGAILFLGGIVVVLVHILFVKRPLTPKGDLETVAAPADYGLLTVYSVFIAWLGTQVVCGYLAQPFVKGLTADKLNIIGAALITAAIYLVSNGPGLLYIYFFALRPNKLKFLDSLKFRLSFGSRGIKRMIGNGIMAWMAAVPLMLLAYYIGNRFLGSQGSSNPIIAIVTEAARSENFSATLLFYITLGVLAPLCEEALFRGFLYTYFRRFFGVLPATIMSASLFSVAHLDPGGLLPLFCLGSVFAISLEKTKSLLPAIIAHGLWNSSTFTLVLMLFSN